MALSEAQKPHKDRFEGAKTKLLAICCWDPPGGGRKQERLLFAKITIIFSGWHNVLLAHFAGSWKAASEEMERERPLSLSLPLSLSSFSFHFRFLFPLSLPHWNVSLLSRNVKIRHLSRIPKIWTCALRGNKSGSNRLLRKPRKMCYPESSQVWTKDEQHRGLVLPTVFYSHEHHQ